MTRTLTMTRRECLLSAVGLTFSFMIPLGGCGRTDEVLPETEFANAWVRIAPDGTTTILAPAAEMGQGSMTALPIILAEELDADWDKVRIEFSPADDELYANPVFWAHGIMLTVGSSAVTGYFDQLRLYGAQARRVLLESAAAKWGVPIEELSTEPGVVAHAHSGQRLSYGEIASFTESPDGLPDVVETDLKDPSQFRLIGHDLPRRDIPSKVDGSEHYSIDIELPDMVYATVLRAPVMGARPVAIDDKRARGLPDVIRIVKLPYGVAAVGRTYAAALAAEKALEVQWSAIGTADQFDSERAVEEHAEIVQDLARVGISTQDEGDTGAAFEHANTVHEAVYKSDLLYHAHLEPLNSVSWVTDGGRSVEIWAGSQAPTHLVRSVAEALDIATENVVLHRTMLGGAFGRRAAQDHDWVVDSALLSKELGRPVKVIWSRESDVHFGRFKPLTAHYLRAAEDESGKLVAWHHRLASDEPLSQSDPYRYARTKQWPVISGFGIDTIYDFPNVKTEVVRTHTGIRMAPLRGVGASLNKFAAESFIDEIAARKGRDPVEFRMELLHKVPAAQRVLQSAADLADWHSGDLGQGLGVAFSELDGTLFATVARVSVNKDSGVIQVHDVWVAVDAGIPIQPRNIVGQVEGSVIFALSNALKERITIKHGAVQQSNFYDYHVLRMAETPRIHTHIVPSKRTPTGIGDNVGVAVAPAVANAFAALTGRRLYHLPFTTERVLETLQFS